MTSFFKNFLGRGLPSSLHDPCPHFSCALLLVQAPLSILGPFAPSTRSLPLILERLCFALNFQLFRPPKINSRFCGVYHMFMLSEFLASFSCVVWQCQELPVQVIFLRCFHGLTMDIKQRYQYYISDFRDGIHLDCLASIVFLYFACITPIVTFGGLMGHQTDGYMASHCLFDSCFSPLSALLNDTWC